MREAFGFQYVDIHVCQLCCHLNRADSDTAGRCVRNRHKCFRAANQTTADYSREPATMHDMAILPYAVVPPGLIPPRIDGPEMANPNVRSQPGCTRRSPYRPAWWASICECSWS